MFCPGYILNDGKKVDTPLLDGVLERAYSLCDEWCTKRRELRYVPWPSLLFLAIEHVDVARQVEGFKKAGLRVHTALGYSHSHLSERLMFAGVEAFLLGETWDFGRSSSWFTEEELSVPPPFKGLIAKEPTADRLREFFVRDLETSIGPEATEHLLQATLAADRWTRERREKRIKKFKDHNQPGESFNQSKQIIEKFRGQLATSDTQKKFDLLAPILQQYPPDELEEVIHEFTAEDRGNLQQVFELFKEKDVKIIQEQLEAELGTILKYATAENKNANQ